MNLGSIEDILDANLLMEGCNMEMMLKMGEIGLRCVVKVPKERPTMTQVWHELEAALNSVDNFLPKHPLSENCTRLNNMSNQSTTRRIHQWDHDYSQSIVSLDGIGLERFDVDMDSVSFQSASLQCLETSIIWSDPDKLMNRRVIIRPVAQMTRAKLRNKMIDGYEEE
ncbi:hypothetical protein BUALT_Bualt16G0078900 [Buddleja alternifolia]|uniref:Uncharacterized protein n=1 Tax=Buddleja alternifolia TaxID=168488 RepID=A0AAV6WFB8_9LAMI|nr:hypothetical protein BUALT_Bualt16G0078900 [Buddleja alternifolia]